MIILIVAPFLLGTLWFLKRWPTPFLRLPKTGEPREIKAPKRQIQELLPSGVFLREMEPIPNVSSESYLVIYINHPKVDKPEETSPTLYMTCPESTTGRAIEGVYYLALFQDGAIVNTVAVPPKNKRQALVFQNTKLNIHWKFGGPKPSPEEEFEPEEVKLINFEDYTGDGQKHEFRLTGATLACGHTQYLIAGYDKQINQAVVYPVVEGDRSFYWMDNFLPDSSGNVEWRWPCGDHGAEVERYKRYRFDSEKKAYLLSESQESPCY